MEGRRGVGVANVHVDRREFGKALDYAQHAASIAPSDASYDTSSLVVIPGVTGSPRQCAKHLGFQQHELVGIP